MIEIEFINDTTKKLEMYESLFKTLAQTGCDILKITDDIELSVTFVTSEFIHELNRKYRNVDRVTDVITFASEDEEFPIIEGIPRLLGDIFICYDQGEKQAKDFHHSVDREICFLFVHGFLHLLGYDHMNEDDAQIMFDLQEKILNTHGIKREE